MVVRTVLLPPFWSLVEAHGDELLVHARRLAGDADAEDVLQDALLRALRAYPRLQHADHLRAWLYRVTTTTALDHHRKRSREQLTDAPPTVATEPELYDDGFEAVKDVTFTAVGYGLQEAFPDDDGFEALIRPLSDGAQAALRLRFIDDLDYDAVARRLGCSVVAARQRVSTALRTLRAQELPT